MLQSTMMATTKGQSHTVQGWFWCSLHCIIYTLCICLFLWKLTPLLFVGIFFSHFFIDKFSLAEKWNTLVRGRTFKAAQNETDENKKPFTVAFTCLVYVVVDNTMHFLLMWAVLYALNII